MSAELIRWAKDVEPEPVTWAYDGYIPHHVVTLIAGARNAGKTLVALWFAREVARQGGSVWVNTGEDALESVIRPRLDVASADLGRIRVSAEPYRFPRDLDDFEVAVAAHADEGQPNDLVVLDSLQRHIPRFQQAEEAIAAMEGLGRIARDYGFAVVVVAHLNKTRGKSVEVAIGGSNGIQAQAKVIHLLGPSPAADRFARIRQLLDPSIETGKLLALACERIGIAAPPETLVFEKRTERYEPTNRAEPFLELVGRSDATADAVLAAVNRASEGGRESETKIAMSAEFVLDCLIKGPRPTKEVEEAAKAAGRYFSRNTFDRARDWLQLRAISPADLKLELGASAYAALSDEERACWWMALPQLPQSPEAWGSGGPQGSNP